MPIQKKKKTEEESDMGENKTYRITVQGVTKEYAAETPYEQIAEEFQGA